MLSIPWIPTHIALPLPPVFVEFMYLSPRWLQKIIFFLPVFKGKSGTSTIIYAGILPDCNELASLLKVSNASVSAQPLEGVLEMVFLQFSGFYPKVSWNSPFFM